MPVIDYSKFPLGQCEHIHANQQGRDSTGPALHTASLRDHDQCGGQDQEHVH